MNILWKRGLTGRLFSQNLTWPDGSLTQIRQKSPISINRG